MLSPSELPQTMLSPELQLPQTMLSPSELPHTVLSQSAPPQSLPHTMLSPFVEEPHTMLSPLSAMEPQTMLSPVVAIVFALPHTTVLAHAFADGFMMPPLSRWLPQRIWRLHTDCTGTLSPTFGA